MPRLLRHISTIIGALRPALRRAGRGRGLLAGLILFNLIGLGLPASAQNLLSSPRQAHLQSHWCAPADPAKAHTRPVWRGRGGWLFERSDIIETLHLCGPLHPYLDRLALALRRQGVTPLALVVPTRGSVHSAQMGKHSAFEGYDAAAAAAGYRAFLRELRRAGFIAPDLLAVAPGKPPFFFKRDHHWSPAGARRSAERVAAAAQAVLRDDPPQTFSTRRVGSARQLGTLQKRAETCCGLRFPLEPVPLFKTVQKPAATTDISSALFGDIDVPVALTGTSNSLRGEDKPEMNFSGFLREALRHDVLNTSFSGAGLFGSLEAYLNSQDYRAAPPKLLVWETLYMNWHNNRLLETQERQIVPSVYGPCAQALVSRRVERSWLQVINLAEDLAGFGLSGHDVYLHLDFDDVTIVNFSLGLGYQKGSETLEISRTTRVPNSGDYFVELTRGLGALKSAELQTLRPLSGGVTLSACRVPQPHN